MTDEDRLTNASMLPIFEAITPAAHQNRTAAAALRILNPPRHSNNNDNDDNNDDGNGSYDDDNNGNNGDDDDDDGAEKDASPEFDNLIPPSGSESGQSTPRGGSAAVSRRSSATSRRSATARVTVPRLVPGTVFSDALNVVLNNARSHIRGGDSKTGGTVKVTARDIVCDPEEDERRELWFMIEGLRRSSGMHIPVSHDAPVATLQYVLDRATEVLSRNQDVTVLLEGIARMGDLIHSINNVCGPFLPMNNYNVLVRQACGRSTFRYAVYRLMQGYRGNATFSPVREVMAALLMPIVMSVFAKLVSYLTQRYDNLAEVGHQFTEATHMFASFWLGTNPSPHIPATTPGVFADEGGDLERPKVQPIHEVDGGASNNVYAVPKFSDDEDDDDDVLPSPPPKRGPQPMPMPPPPVQHQPSALVRQPAKDLFTTDLRQQVVQQAHQSVDQVVRQAYQPRPSLVRPVDPQRDRQIHRAAAPQPAVALDDDILRRIITRKTQSDEEEDVALSPASDEDDGEDDDISLEPPADNDE